MNEKILVLKVLSILGGISRGTYRRLTAEDSLPKPENVGRQQYQNTKELYDWLSSVAKRKVQIGDELLSSKQLEKLFDSSSTWVWMHFQKNKTMKVKAVRLRSRPYWLLSDIHGNKELSAYLEVVKSKEVKA